MQKYSDRGGIEKMKSRNLKALLFGAAFAASLTFVGAQPPDAALSALEVHAASYQDVELDSKYDFEKAFQKALDVARDSEDKKHDLPYQNPGRYLQKPAAALMYTATPILIWKATPIPSSGSSMFRFWT